jgi:hypothetical protein
MDMPNDRYWEFQSIISHGFVVMIATHCSDVNNRYQFGGVRHSLTPFSILHNYPFPHSLSQPSIHFLAF